MEQENQPIANHQPEQVSNIERLADEIHDTNVYLKEIFSIRMVIVRGLITGFVIVIGSTVLASIMFSILHLIFGDIPYIPSGGL